jgi:hypothetical protein
MANVPFPLTGDTADEARWQTFELIRQLYEEKIGGADLGDVFSLPGDVLTLTLADASGLTKAGNVLAVEPTSTGGLQVNANGLGIKLDGATLTLTAAGLKMTTSATPPGGSDTEVQFNDGGAFGADADFAFDKTTNQLDLGFLTAGFFGASLHGGIYGDVTYLNLTSFIDATVGPYLTFSQARATTPFFTASGDYLGILTFKGFGGVSTFNASASIAVKAADVFSATSTPADIIFSTTPIGSLTPVERMTFRADGNVLLKVGTIADLAPRTTVTSLSVSRKTTPHDGISTAIETITSCADGSHQDIYGIATELYNYGDEGVDPDGFGVGIWAHTEALGSGFTWSIATEIFDDAGGAHIRGMELLVSRGAPSAKSSFGLDVTAHGTEKLTCAIIIQTYGGDACWATGLYATQAAIGTGASDSFIELVDYFRVKRDGTLVVAGKAVTEGAADSGGTGYKVLRVPN